MSRPYYTLLQRIGGKWTPQFGDYDREIVTYESWDRRSAACPPVKARDLKIIKTPNSRKATIEAKIKELNDANVVD